MRGIVLNAVDEVHKHETIQADVAFHEGLQKSRGGLIFISCILNMMHETHTVQLKRYGDKESCCKCKQQCNHDSDDGGNQQPFQQ